MTLVALVAGAAALLLAVVVLLVVVPLPVVLGAVVAAAPAVEKGATVGPCVAAGFAVVAVALSELPHAASTAVRTPPAAVPATMRSKRRRVHCV